MIEIDTGSIISDTGAARLDDGATRTCRGCVIDSREVTEGRIFVALPGERVDGNVYARAAIDAGAACVVLTAPPADGLIEAAHAAGTCVLRAADDDGEEFMLRLAGAWRHRQDWFVIGVTGSVGKTTTKDMLAAVLGCRYRCEATSGNFNNLLGVPLTLMGADSSSEVLVVEMGMNHPGEIARLAEAAAPQLAVITNIGLAHIGLLGSREAIARAKAEIVPGLARPLPSGIGLPGCLFLPAGDDFEPLIRHEYADPAGVACITCGTSRSADVSCGPVSLDGEGHPSFDVSLAGGTSLPVSLSLAGRAVVADALEALAVAEYVGVDMTEAARALASMRPAAMRQDIVDAPGGWRVIDDTYNASPASCAAALDILSSLSCTGRRIAVLGEMGELGDEAMRLHELVGAYAAGAHPDLLVTCGGELAGGIARAARAMGFSDDGLVSVATPQEAASVLGPNLEKGDLVLAKGSRAAGLDEFVREVVAPC